MGVTESQIEKSYHQILATKTHHDSADKDTNFLVDFDLAILGVEPEKYVTFTHQIRQEYAIYPAFLYKKGRGKVVQHFLDMDVLFKTEEMKSKYEERARTNLKTELEAL